MRRYCRRAWRWKTGALATRDLERVVVDTTVALAGSLNLDQRSLFLNYELMVAFYDAPAIARYALRLAISPTWLPAASMQSASSTTARSHRTTPSPLL